MLSPIRSSSDLSVHRQGEYSYSSMWAQVPVVCRVLPLLLAAAYLLPGARDLLSLSLDLVVFRGHVWSLWTSVLLEGGPLSLGIACMSATMFGRHVEGVMGARGYVIFLLVSVGASSCIVLVYDYVRLVASGEGYETDVFYHGFSAVLVADLVALKQLIPEHELLVGFVVPLRFKHLPLSSLLVSVVFQFLWPSRGFVHSLACLPVSWIYLRFVQGDRSPEFSLASFFPAALRPVANPFSNSIDACCCWKHTPSSGPPVDIEQQPQRVVSQRRALASALLNDRLAANHSAAASPTVQVAVQLESQEPSSSEGEQEQDLAPTPIRKKA